MDKNIFDRLMSLDRRWVFLFVAGVCVATYFVPFDVPVRIEAESRVIYDVIDGLKPGEIVFVPLDYDPSTVAELHPMTYAIVEHCFRKRLKVLMTALHPNGPGMAEQALLDVADSMKLDRAYNGVAYSGREVASGVDYTFLGYKPYPALVILGMGQNFRIPFPTDYYGVPLDSLPMMQGVQNYDQVACVVNVSGTSGTDYWISYGQGRFGFRLALGLTGVMGADYYPYLNSGQIFGLMAGLYGAAQYEDLADNPGLAKDGMRVQVYAHMVIILFIVMGNVGYFMGRRRRQGKEEE